MWLPSSRTLTNASRGGVGRHGLVAVAIDRDKGSQHALKWAIENLLGRGQTVILIHVVKRSSTTSSPSSSFVGSFGNNYAVHDLNGATNIHNKSLEKQTKDLLLTFHCFCTRKDVHCLDVVLEDMNIAKAITDYISKTGIESLVLGSSKHGFLKRLKAMDVPASVSKGAPDFCTIYVISKSKIASVKNMSRVVPFESPLITQIQQMEEQANAEALPPSISLRRLSLRGGDMTPQSSTATDDTNSLKSPPLGNGGGNNSKMFCELLDTNNDISFVSSDRTSVDHGSSVYDRWDSSRFSRMSSSSESSFGSIRSAGTKCSGLSSFTDFSSSSIESDGAAAEMRRLKQELQMTMEMYSTACKAVRTAEQKTIELNQWRKEEERRLLAEETARMTAEREKAKYKAAMENAQAAQRSVESQNRESYETMETDIPSRLSYRRYTIEEIEEATENFSQDLKVGEGGYGPVFRCHLDHTAVAVKVLRPDAAQGRNQFNKEIEVLSCMRHPNMVLLLGACPEYGCLVYEYMANGSLEDRLRRKDNTQALSWQLRFRIAAEIATGLHFFHQMKPEPLVHRDLKPGNILLDQNYVSKISDVGLARLVPFNVADEVSQYHMTSAAGTFCYIDPEYQQTGMLGLKSDVYSFGIILLQLLTAKPAMGITHIVDQAIENGNLHEVLDSSVKDWPIEESTVLAKLALQCAELRKKDRPNLGKVLLPELYRLKCFGEENMRQLLVGSPSPSLASVSEFDRSEGVKSEPRVQHEYSHEGEFESSASLPDSVLEYVNGLNLNG